MQIVRTYAGARPRILRAIGAEALAIFPVGSRFGRIAFRSGRAYRLGAALVLVVVALVAAVVPARKAVTIEPAAVLRET